MKEGAPRVVVVGFGGWGQNHVRTFHALSALAGVVDSSPERRAAAAAAYPGVPIHAELGAALADPSVAGVVVASPAVTHAALVRRALEAGRDVLTEKPLALRASEGRALVAHARAAGRVLAVGHLLEVHPAFEALLREVRAGTLGRVQHLAATRHNLGRVRNEENVLWSLAPHDVALVLRVAGEQPSEVVATASGWLQAGIPDTAFAELRFPSGLRAHVHVSWVHPVKEQRLVVTGERGVLVFDDVPPARRLALWRDAVVWDGPRPVARKGEPELLPFAADEPLRRQAEAFLRSIATREPPVADGESALRVLEVLDACQRSIDAGGAVTAVATPPARPYFVHPTALVDEGAEVGEGSKIWHYSHVMPKARVGRRCILGQNVHIASKAILGDGCKLQNNVSVYEGVELEDDVFCAPSMVFTNVRNPRAHVERKDEYRKTRVGRGASIGANATVVCGTTLGRYCFVGAGSVVTRDVPPYALVFGTPARVQGWMCACGERLAVAAKGPEGERTTCPRCAAAYVRVDGHVAPTAAPV